MDEAEGFGLFVFAAADHQSVFYKSLEQISRSFPGFGAGAIASCVGRLANGIDTTLALGDKKKRGG